VFDLVLRHLSTAPKDQNTLTVLDINLRILHIQIATCQCWEGRYSPCGMPSTMYAIERQTMQLKYHTLLLCRVLDITEKATYSWTDSHTVFIPFTHPLEPYVDVETVYPPLSAT